MIKQEKQRFISESNVVISTETNLIPIYTEPTIRRLNRHSEVN